MTFIIFSSRDAGGSVGDRKIAAHRCLREMGADVISSLIADPHLLEDLLLGFSPPTQKGSRDPE